MTPGRSDRSWSGWLGAACAFMLCAVAPSLAQTMGADVPPPARAEPAFLSPEWPVRIAPEGARGVIVPLEGVPSEWRERRLGAARAGADAIDRRDIEALLPEGRRSGVKLEGRNAMVFVRSPADRRPEEGAEMVKFISARPAGPAGPADPAGDAPMLERTWFGIYQPRGEHRRGVTLMLPGMFGTPRPLVDAAVEQLRDAGWGVVRMMSHPSRFTQRFEVVVDPDGGVVPEAEVIAAELGQRVAEAAYASAAALDEAVRRHPWMGAAPLVALGMSGGAMILPSVVALEPERYTAAVVIAGGANFLEIIMRSNYAAWIGAAEVRFAEGATAADARALREAYLARAPLDSFHTARVLEDLPTLMIHGSRDLAVPAATGDLLWERAGRPLRWSRPMGHETLFLRLALQVGDVIDWMNATTDPADPEGAGAAGAP